MSKLKIWLILALVLASTLSITAKVNYDQAIVYSLKNGGNLYKKACAVCHGKRADVIPPGSHARVPINNRDPYTLLVMLNTYRQGYANNGGANAIMAAALLRHKFSDEELRDIAFYVDSLEEEKEPLDEKEKQEIAKALKQGEERQAELARAEAERLAEAQRLAEAERLAQEEAERLAQEEAQKEALAQAEAQRMVEEQRLAEEQAQLAQAQMQTQAQMQAETQMQEAEPLAQATQAQNAPQPLSPEQQLAATEQTQAQQPYTQATEQAMAQATQAQAEFASTPQETPQAQNQLTPAQQAAQAEQAQMAQMAQSGASSSNASNASSGSSGSGAYADIAQLTPQQDFSESPLIAQAEQTPQYTQYTQATQIPQGQIPQQYGENAQIAQQYTQTPQMLEQLQGASSSQGTHIPPTQTQTQGAQGTHLAQATQTQNTQTPTHNAATSQDYIAQAEQLQGATPQGNIHTQTPTQGSQAMQSTQVIQGTQAYNAQSPQRATLARETPQIIQASQTTQSPHTQTIAQTIAHTPQNHITQNHLRGYYYQIAAYHGEVPKEILSQMREHDYIVYESSSNGKPLYRYLVGIYDSPQSMQKDRAQINALTKATHIQKDMKPIVRYINEHNELFVVENGKPTQKLTSITSNMANANKNKISIDITYLKNPVIKTSTPRLMPVIIKPQDINNVIKQNHILITQNDLTPIEPSNQNKTKDTKRRDNFIDLGPQVRTAEAKLPPPHSNLKSRLTIRDNQVKTNSVNMDNYIDLSIPN